MCVNLAMGNDYLAQGLSNINNVYMRFYNEPLIEVYFNKTKVMKRHNDV